MNVSLIVTGGFIKHPENSKEAALESERLLATYACLGNLGSLNTDKGDEIIFAEYGEESRLKGIAGQLLKSVRHQYVFVQGKGFNQSKIKNAGADAASNEIVCWINSDVIVEQNIFDVLRSAFETIPNSFVTAARHDVFIKSSYLRDFIEWVNDKKAYVPYSTALEDAGWHHALNRPKTPIPTTIKAFIAPGDWNVIHDFTQGYINYGELMAVRKIIWQKYPFDEEITAIVDSFYRDIIFGNEPYFTLQLIHSETSVFHLSGSDYMQQVSQGTGKYTRLIEDIIKAAKKYPCMQHWLVFSYFREFDEAIAELKIPFKDILEKWRTPFMWKYYRDKERVKELYGVSDE